MENFPKAPGAPPLDVHFEPTPARVIPEMLRLARIAPGDCVYEPGCGEASLLRAAVRDFGARGVGIDLDGRRLAEARRLASAEGLGGAIEFIEGDLFEIDPGPADVVLLYLLDSLNERLRPALLSRCRPGTRVVSYSFEMGDWRADVHQPVAANGVFLWVVPARLAGLWQSPGERLSALLIDQTFQHFSGAACLDGRALEFEDGRIDGEGFTFSLSSGDGAEPLRVTGKLTGDSMEAGFDGAPAVTWRARRK